MNVKSVSHSPLDLFWSPFISRGDAALEQLHAFGRSLAKFIIYHCFIAVFFVTKVAAVLWWELLGTVTVTKNSSVVDCNHKILSR